MTARASLGRVAPRLAAVAALIACAGCPSLVMRSRRNAMGHVDLAAPPAHERGEPDAFEAPADPGEERSMLLPGAFVGIGNGRRFEATELGVQVRVTFPEADATSSGRDQFPFVSDAWGATLGWGIAQLDASDKPTHAAIGGPIYAEVNRHVWIFGVGAGVAVYPRETEAGPQLSAWCWPYLFRVRYEPGTGWEVYGGYQVELPTLWIWSR